MNNKQVLKYKDSILEYQKVLQKSKITVGYVPTTIRHYFHGAKKNRKYLERNEIIYKYQYNPYKFIKNNVHGIMEPTTCFPQDMLNDIITYFKERDEDSTGN